MYEIFLGIETGIGCVYEQASSQLKKKALSSGCETGARKREERKKRGGVGKGKSQTTRKGTAELGLEKTNERDT